MACRWHQIVRPSRQCDVYRPNSTGVGRRDADPGAPRTILYHWAASSPQSGNSAHAAEQCIRAVGGGSREDVVDGRVEGGRLGGFRTCPDVDQWRHPPPPAGVDRLTRRADSGDAPTSLDTGPVALQRLTPAPASPQSRKPPAGTTATCTPSSAQASPAVTSTPTLSPTTMALATQSQAKCSTTPTRRPRPCGDSLQV